MNINFVIPCLLGLERPIADELIGMGADDVRCENGRVLFCGDFETLARANICSRYAERILILVGSFKARSFEELFEGTKALAWEEWIGKLDAFPVKGFSLNSTLFSVSDCQSIIKKAVVERLKQTYKIPWFEESGSVYQIQFSIMKDVVSLMIDTSGQGLHKRGYRPQANTAPIKETLAAAICNFSRLRHFHTLYDPMCGSGTILIEGAMLAGNIAPGKNRSFTAETWANIDKSIWQIERERAIDLEKTDIDFKAFGYDIDEKSLEIAKENTKRAGLSHLISYKKQDLKDFLPISEKGTLITNPPYGERLLDIDSAHEIYKTMGKVFIKKHGWSYSIITSDEDFEKQFSKAADKRRKLYNGMIKCQLYMYFK